MEAYFREVLEPMVHPLSGERLEWSWGVDFYHACEYVSKLACSLFGSGEEASAWAAKQRRVLREKRGGVARVIQSAAQQKRRLLADAIRLWRRKAEISPEEYASRRARLATRLQALIDTDWNNTHAKRLLKRLRRHQGDVFTFLDHENVPFDNNHAERCIRPAVILRKNSYGNRSQRGADCQAVLMSVLRTLKQRGHDPIRTVVTALEHYLLTGQLPPLPTKTTSGG